MKDISEVRLIGTADVPERTYMLSAPNTGNADLHVVACGGWNRTGRSGTLQATRIVPVAAPDTKVVVGQNDTLVLGESRVVGPSEDEQLPDGQVRIVVRLLGGSSLDWNTVSPQLTLQNGWSQLAGESVSTPDGRELRFLAPALSTSQDALPTLPRSSRSLRPWMRVSLESSPRPSP